MAGAILIACAVLFVGLYARAGLYGFNALLHRGPTYWTTVTADDSRLSPSMRLALRDRTSALAAGRFEWRLISHGFEAAELPVRMGDSEVDRLLLARIDPAHFRIVVRTSPAGDTDLGQ